MASVSEAKFVRGLKKADIPSEGFAVRCGFVTIIYRTSSRTPEQTMLETRDRIRKGARSCTECRRRKVRCVRTSEDAPACRQCEERGSQCIAQTTTLSHNSNNSDDNPFRPLGARRLPSRYRISQLESQVTNLTKAVRNLESTVGYLPGQSLESANIDPRPAAGLSDDGSSVSEEDILTANQPSHLRSLFQNDWLTADTRGQNPDHRQTRSSAHLLDMARQALQTLIPPKDELTDFARSASRWLDLLHSVLPLPFTIKGQEEILESYDIMRNSQVDVIKLATWLLTVAITAQQIPQDNGNPETQPRKWERRLAFCRAVSDTVERTVFSQDRVISTTHGLVMAIHFLRLLIAQGAFPKAWLRLRRVIAVAELMGLPRILQTTELDAPPGSGDEEKQLNRTQLWEMICAADRMLGMILNIPPYTRRFRPRKDQPLIINGVVQPRVYLGRLMNVAGRIQQLDDVNATDGSPTEMYASALELVRDLRELASQTPESWWEGEADQVKADHVVQYLHCYILMRVHLPFTMRQDPGEEYSYSRLACMDACQSLARRYRFLRRMLPPGFFLSGILDIQAFTATVVLILTSHSPASTNRLDLRIDKAKLQDEVEQVIQTMRERSSETLGGAFIKNAVTTLCSLNRLLQQDNHNAPEGFELTVKVPLLGEVHIRRNTGTYQMPEINNARPSQSLAGPSFSRPIEQSMPPLPTTSASMEPTWAEGDWQWNSLSWSVEDNYQNLFQDAFMEDSFDQFAAWGDTANNLSFDL